MSDSAKLTSLERGNCKTCIYWRKQVRAPWQSFSDSGRTVVVEHAQCRRRAPIATPERLRDLSQAMWPEVEATDWCGDYNAGRLALTKDTHDAR